MKKAIFAILLIVIASLPLKAGDIPQAIITSFSTGNASALSSYFSESIELTLFDKEEIYSNTQAEIILTNFFKENNPKSFKIIHQGGKESSKYAIGNLVTANKTFRITFLLKSNGSKTYIHQLRIENAYGE